MGDVNLARWARTGAEPRRESAEDLLARVARGDEAAFDELYRTASGPIYGLLLRLVRDPAQAEEVAQEVLVQIWRQASRFDPAKGGAMTWMLTMAHRRGVDVIRSAQRSSDRDQRVAARDTERDYDQVVDIVEHRLEREQVQRALTTLTEVQREAVTLAYYGGYTHREVAELLDVPVGTVKTRVRDGLIRLRDTMEVTP